MINYLLLFGSVLQLLYIFRYGSCDQITIRKINPYEQVFKMLLKEPPITGNKYNKNYDEIKELWLEQAVDHFDKNNNETWPMRYLINDNLYRLGSPIFIFVGGEWEIQPHVLQYGHFYDMAKQHEALMFYTEHRYYGQIWPNSNSLLHSLQYLNVLQSLEDLKYFIDFQKSSQKALQKTKVVLVGGSYSGSMVSWFMKLYPQMADAAWASSAPLLAKMDFHEYMTLTMASIQQKGGLACAKKLDKAFKGLVEIMTTTQANTVFERLKICQSFNNTDLLDRQAFFNGLGNYFGGLVQSYSSLIPQFCLSFTSLDSQPTEALIKYLAELFLSSANFKVREGEEEEWCLDFSYQGMKSIFANTNEPKTGSRPWFYQTCHEFGWFSITALRTLQTTLLSNTSAAIFGGQVSLTYFQQLCQDIFGNVGHGSVEHHYHHHRLTIQQLHTRAEAINKLFGGFSNVSKRVIFTHGLLDPWRAAGLQHGLNVLLLQDYSHVDDMGSIDLSDTVEMNVAKLKVASFITKLIKDH